MQRRPLRAVGDDEPRAGRPPIEIETALPPDLAPLVVAKSEQQKFGLADWRKALGGEQQRQAYVANEYSPEAWANLEPGTFGPWRPEAGMAEGFVPITDLHEMDRVMCRGWISLDIDTAWTDDLIDRVGKKAVAAERAKLGRFAQWASHNIATLFNFQQAGRDLSNERKQLAAWLFPDIADADAREGKFDRAKGYLEEALNYVRNCGR